MRSRTYVVLAVTALALVAGYTVVNGVDANNAAEDDRRPSLSIVAGSEQQVVIDEIVNPWCTEHELRCSFTFKGSVDQARLLASDNRDFDAYWFASSVFLQVGDRKNVLTDVQPMFLTPVVFAGWQGHMGRLGFTGRTDITVGDILAAVESGTVRVWATNPTQSNSGATALFSILNHIAGNGPGQALTQQQLDSAPVDAGITRFIRAIESTPPSTGTLMDECVSRPADCQTMFTYEDLVIERNRELVRAGKEPLVVAYPRGALAISDAPFGFRPHGTAADADKRKIFTDLQRYLLTDAGALAKLTALGRRPATGVGLSLDNADRAVFNPDWGIQPTINEQPIQYPSAAVIQAVLNRYQTHYRRPVDAYYCLDGSGSMGDNGGWNGVREAAHQVFDQDQAAENLLQSHPEDRTTVAIFNTGVAAGPWTVAGNDPGTMHDLAERVRAYRPGGGTNMYTCLSKAASELKRVADPNRKRLVIAMTDGQSEAGGRDAALSALKSAGVPVIAIAFGSDIDANQLTEVTKATGGAYSQQKDLVAALRQAAGYK